MNLRTSRLCFLPWAATAVGLLGSCLFGIAQPARGQVTSEQPTLIAQRVIEGLPPPPPIPDLQQSPSPAIAPALPSPAAASQANPETLYLVYVNGDSPLLLDQVQQVEPTAIVQDYGGQPVIVAGVFADRDDAEDQAEALADQGIEAEIAPTSSIVSAQAPALDPAAANLPVLPPADVSPAVPREVEFRSPVPSPAASAPTPVVSAAPPVVQESSYYIVVPGDSDRLSQMQEQVILLGARQSAIAQREQPLGPHLLIGPFVDRSAATRWNRFLRDFGMDARVYYKR
ncbi:MAG: hypothetical protein VKK04_18850 [Synechococcales bacterium]|nr:hypothetical protein [Synechococcales bacterium]